MYLNECDEYIALHYLKIHMKKRAWVNNFQDILVNYLLWLLHISLFISYENLVPDQDNTELLPDKFHYSLYLFTG